MPITHHANRTYGDTVHHIQSALAFTRQAGQTLSCFDIVCEWNVFSKLCAIWTLKACEKLVLASDFVACCHTLNCLVHIPAEILNLVFLPTNYLYLLTDKRALAESWCHTPSFSCLSAGWGTYTLLSCFSAKSGKIS